MGDKLIITNIPNGGDFRAVLNLDPTKKYIPWIEIYYPNSVLTSNFVTPNLPVRPLTEPVAPPSKEDICEKPAGEEPSTSCIAVYSECFYSGE